MTTKALVAFTSGCMIAQGVGAALARADSTDAGSSAGTAADKSVAVVGGLVDIYYGYNFNNPSAASLPGTTTLPPSQNGPYRNFDLYHDQFGLNAAEISISKKGKEMGVKADFDFGEITDTIHSAAGATGTSDEVSKHIGQAVVTYNPIGVPNLTVNVGKMYTHMGLETTKSKDNWQYSRSFLYAVSIPYWHLGANVAYAWIPGKLSTGFYLYNGWNSLYSSSNSTSSGKTYGFQLALTPLENLSIYYNVIAGAGGPGYGGHPIVNDLNATYAISADWSFAADMVAGTVNDAVVSGATAASSHSWYAATLATKYIVSPRYYVSPRFEVYRDADGYTTGGVGQSLSEITLTNGFPLAEGFETRLEGRWDHSTASIFPSSDLAKTSQVTAALALLYSF